MTIENPEPLWFDPEVFYYELRRAEQEDPTWPEGGS